MPETKPYTLECGYTPRHHIVDLILYPARAYGPLMGHPDEPRSPQAELLVFSIRAAAQKAAELYSIRARPESTPVLGILSSTLAWDLIPVRRQRATLKYVLEVFGGGPPWGGLRLTSGEMARLREIFERMLPGVTAQRAA